MTRFRENYKAATIFRCRALGRKLTADEMWDEAASIHQFAVLELQKEWEKRRKERKKAGIDERAGGIYNLYPRKEGGTEALLSISKAIQRDGYEKVMAGTTEYASAVARWSPARKRAQSGESKLAMPTTWFNQGRYNDDPKAWWEGTGGKAEAEKPKIMLPEPWNWREVHPESRPVRENIAWQNLDETTQKWIVDNTPQQKLG